MTDRIETVAPGTWNDLLERSGQATPFHRSELLERCAVAVGARLYRYVGYKGQQPTGLFPVLALRRGATAVALSPPPGVVPYGGPALLGPDGLKRRKRERWNRSFVESVLERVEEDVDPDYWQLRTSPAYDDERPFVWNDFDAAVRHTYVVGLPDEKRLEALDPVERPGARVTETDGPAGDVLGLIADRYADHRGTLTPEPPLLRSLYRVLPDGCMRVYACRDGDRLVGAEVTLELGDTVYGWLGATDTSAAGAEDLLYDRLLRDAVRRGYTEYDLLGTEDPRVFRHRAELGAELRSSVRLVRGGPVSRLTARLCGLAP